MEFLLPSFLLRNVASYPRTNITSQVVVYPFMAFRITLPSLELPVLVLIY